MNFLWSLKRFLFFHFDQIRWFRWTNIFNAFSNLEIHVFSMKSIFPHFVTSHVKFAINTKLIIFAFYLQSCLQNSVQTDANTLYMKEHISEKMFLFRRTKYSYKYSSPLLFLRS